MKFVTHPVHPLGGEGGVEDGCLRGVREGKGEERGGERGREERGGGGGEGEKVFYFSLFIITSSAARTCSHLYPPPSSPFPSLSPLGHPSSTPPSPPSGWTGWLTNLKKKSKAVDKFLWTPARLAMGKRKDREWGQQVEGKRMRAESADDQDQQVSRRFEELIEHVGPEKFRRLGGASVPCARNRHG